MSGRAGSLKVVVLNKNLSCNRSHSLFNIVTFNVRLFSKISDVEQRGTRKQGQSLEQNTTFNAMPNGQAFHQAS